MTEERFAQIIENAVEGAADKFDNIMERGWKHKPMRIISKILSFSAGIGLILGAIPLAEKGHTLASKICMLGGIITLIVESLMLLIFRKR